jgi:hypothetical protein
MEATGWKFAIQEPKFKQKNSLQISELDKSSLNETGSGFYPDPVLFLIKKD